MNKPSYINGHRVLGWVNDTPVMDDFSQKSEELIKPLLRGRDITRYGIPSKNDLDYIILAGFGSYKYFFGYFLDLGIEFVG
jgi:hypothetical protein